MKQHKLTSIELCAGAGGQAIGIEKAGFEHYALVEIDEHCCLTLHENRPKWRGRIFERDLRQFDAKPYEGIDLLAGGLPCPPFSKAGKQLGENDERNLFPEALRIIEECKPRAIMIENVRGILDDVFDDFRNGFQQKLENKGYVARFELFNASKFGVPQLRPRVVFVALKEELWQYFKWPVGKECKTTVGETLYEMMASNGWKGAAKWRDKANTIAPTIVGGSKKHGGPDLGPTRAKRAWETLGVNGLLIGNEPPGKNFVGNPTLTVEMVAKLQGFPESWKFMGRKTHAYRQVGNAFPPPVAEAVAKQIAKALRMQKRKAITLPFEEVA